MSAVDSDINLSIPLAPSPWAHEGTKNDLKAILNSLRILQQELSDAKARITALEPPP